MSLLIQRKNDRGVFSNIMKWLGWFDVSLLSGAVPSFSLCPHMCVALLLSWILYSFDLSVIRSSKLKQYIQLYLLLSGLVFCWEHIGWTINSSFEWQQDFGRAHKLIKFHFRWNKCSVGWYRPSILTSGLLHFSVFASCGCPKLAAVL